MGKPDPVTLAPASSASIPNASPTSQCGLRSCPDSNAWDAGKVFLDAHALSITEVDRLTAKLPQISSAQPFDEPRTDGAIRVSTAAIRALFRSKQLAELWSEYLNATSIVQPAAMASKKKEPTSPAKLKAMRQQIEALIKSQGGQWTPEEHPHS